MLRFKSKGTTLLFNRALYCSLSWYGTYLFNHDKLPKIKNLNPFCSCSPEENHYNPYQNFTLFPINHMTKVTLEISQENHDAFIKLKTMIEQMSGQSVSDDEVLDFVLRAVTGSLEMPEEECEGGCCCCGHDHGDDQHEGYENYENTFHQHEHHHHGHHHHEHHHGHSCSCHDDDTQCQCKHD